MSQIMNVLQRKFASRYVSFDPTNKDHLEAYYTLRYKGRQDKELRFFLEDPFLDCVSMMQHKITQEHLKNEFGSRDFSF